MKSNFSIEKIGKYLREVSVVVIGVAITLSLSYWITNITEKKDVVLYLDAIKLEMEENIKLLDEEADDLEYWENYALYLRSQDKKSIPADSIRGYGVGLSTTKQVNFQTSAFEMFKTSGAMRLIDDKEILQSIWKAYLNIEEVRFDVNSYYETKKEYLAKEVPLLLEGNPVSIPLYDFFVIFAKHGALEECREMSGELKKTIVKLEKSKYIK